MIATFLNINADKFSLNGVESFKIFIPIIAGDRVMVVNAFDGRRILLNYTNFADFRIDGQSFANPAALVNALNSVIFAWKASDGTSTGNYTGVSLNGNNALKNGSDGGPFLDESRFNFDSPNPTNPGTTAHGIVSLNSGYIDGLNFQPTLVWDFIGTRFSKTKFLSLAPAPSAAGTSRIDVLAGTSDGDIIIITGTPSANPEKPVIDPDTQIEATFFIIEANATAPSGVTGTPIYNEFGTTAGGEWDATETTGGARIQLLSGSQSKVGNVAIEATALRFGDRVIFTPGAPLPISNISEVSFYIKNKPGDPGRADPFSVMLYGTENNGKIIRVWITAPSSNGYDSQNATDWQFLSLQVPTDTKLANIEYIHIRTEAETVNAFGFFIDAVKYSNGTSNNDAPTTGGASVEYVDAGDASTLQEAKDYAEPLNVPPIADNKVAVYNLDGSKRYEDYGGGSAGATPVTKAFTYAGGAQEFIVDTPIIKPDYILVGNTSLQLTQYTWTGSTFTITNTLTNGAVIEIGYWDATATIPIPVTDVISTFLSGAAVDLVAGDTETFEAPYDFTLNNFWIAVTEAPTGSWLTVDVKKAGVSITSTKASIESNEFSSLTGTSPVLATTSFLRGDKITPNISQVGSLETGKSLRIYLEITKL